MSGVKKLWREITPIIEYLPHDKQFVEATVVVLDVPQHVNIVDYIDISSLLPSFYFESWNQNGIKINSGSYFDCNEFIYLL